MGVIDTIIEKKRQRLADAKARRPLGAVRSQAESAEPPRDFRSAVSRAADAPVRLIAELKKASPSKGLIRADFDPATIASIYSQKADAMSVLTEEDFFQGSLEYLKTARAAATIPALRKDFIFDEYQIYEARANGADAILLIAMALEPVQSMEFVSLARELGMPVLFEVHGLDELDHALESGACIIGINNRNLSTLEIDLETTFKVKAEIPAGDYTIVSESGISGPDEVRRLYDAGIDAMLVGTSIMKSPDIGAKIDELRS